MTIVKGQIESLKRLRAELERQGISRFNSVSDINLFQKEYAWESDEVLRKIEEDLDAEIETLRSDKIRLQEQYNTNRSIEREKLNARIDALNSRHDLLQTRDGTVMFDVFNAFRMMIVKFRSILLQRHFNRIVQIRTAKVLKMLLETEQQLTDYEKNRAQVIDSRSVPLLSTLHHTKEVVDGLYPLIAGAVGENYVVKELEKLDDNNILINDFSLKFKSPIYNKKENDRIYSIQIDHLLITNAGVFVIETKNWSKESIGNYNLRSPVDQIKRTSYALFVILNTRSGSPNFALKKHHWGTKQVPVRNLVVMINHKPKEKFNFVAVKSLHELNRYISYFDPVLDDEDVFRIAEYLETY